MGKTGWDWPASRVVIKNNRRLVLGKREWDWPVKWVVIKKKGGWDWPVN